MSAKPHRGQEVFICYDGCPKTKHPAFVGHNRWTVFDFDPKKGVRTKLGWFRSWVRVTPGAD